VGRQFSYWLECENVAIHFNDLLSGLRLKATGGLAVASAVLMSESASASEPKGTAVRLCALASMWLAVAVLDLFYHSDLLRGAVDEVERVERTLVTIQLSSSIEARMLLGERLRWIDGAPDAAQQLRQGARESRPRWVYATFHFLPLAAICVAMGLCFHQCNAQVSRWAVPLAWLAAGAPPFGGAGVKGTVPLSPS
jgi:hypothetical protein